MTFDEFVGLAIIALSNLCQRRRRSSASPRSGGFMNMSPDTWQQASSRADQQTNQDKAERLPTTEYSHPTWAFSFDVLDWNSQTPVFRKSLQHQGHFIASLMEDAEYDEVSYVFRSRVTCHVLLIHKLHRGGEGDNRTTITCVASQMRHVWILKGLHTWLWILRAFVGFMHLFGACHFTSRLLLLVVLNINCGKGRSGWMRQVWSDRSAPKPLALFWIMF